MYDARNVANQFILLAIDDRKPFTPLKIVKLTYYAHAWMLALHNRPIFTQPVRAWKHGPVINDVYFALRDFSGKPVDDLIPLNENLKDKIDVVAQDVINRVYSHYGKYDTSQLYEWVHAAGSPWECVWNSGGRELWDTKNRSAIIDNQNIKEYYKLLLESNLNND